MNMQTTSTFDQIAQYQRDGFLAVPDFLDSSDLQTWRSVTDEAVAERLAQTGQGANADYYAQVFTQCINLRNSHAGMKELMTDARLGEAAGAFAGVDGLRLWHDQALIKGPYGNATSWHLDDPFWSFDSPDSISIWVALDDATIENGCLWYLPETHRQARYDETSIGANMRDLFKQYPDWAQVKAVAAPVKAGSAVFHNGLVAHGAGANMTPGSRRAMTCAYMPDGSTFNGKQNVLPPEYIASLQIGDVLNNDAVNPLVWRKS